MAEQLIILVLATFALAYSFARLEGPFGVFAWVRGHIDPDQRTWKGRGMHCPLCVGFYAAPLAWALWTYLPVVALVLAVWGGSMVVSIVAMKLE